MRIAVAVVVIARSRFLQLRVGPGRLGVGFPWEFRIGVRARDLPVEVSIPALGPPKI